MRKPRDLSLRVKEKQIQQNLFNHIPPNGGDLTVLALVKKYLSLKVNVRHNPQTNHTFVTNILTKEDFGKLLIDKVKLSGTKAWLINLQRNRQMGYIMNTPNPKVATVCARERRSDSLFLPDHQESENAGKEVYN